MEFKAVFVLLGILIFSAITVDALNCYRCEGVNDGPCFDPEANNVTDINCETVTGAGNYVCYKVTGTSGSNDVVSRGCILELGFDAFCTLTGAAIKMDDCVSCKEDLCNSSNRIGLVSITFLVLSLLVAKLL